MNLVTKRELISSMAERWRCQYFQGDHWTTLFRGSAEPIYRQLLQLGADATESDIAAIIGNASGTRNTCDECKQDAEALVVLGFGPENAARVCVPCLYRAIELAERR